MTSSSGIESSTGNNNKYTGSNHKLNSGHYKTAGRELPGQDVDHETNRQKYAEARAEEEAQEFGNGSNSVRGPAPALIPIADHRKRFE